MRFKNLFKTYSRVFLIAILATVTASSIATADVTPSPPPVALTSASYVARFPAWEPNGETIIYSRYNGSVYYNCDLFTVQGDASSVSEIKVASTLCSGHFAESLSWAGSLAIVAESQGLNHEYLSFNVPGTGMQTRNVFDNPTSAAGFTRLLKGDYASSIPGWGGGFPEMTKFVRVSRDGSTVLVRWSSVHTGTPSYVKTTKIFTGPYSSMGGDMFINNNTATDWADQTGVVEHASRTGHYLSAVYYYTYGASLTPDGSKFVMALDSGYDLDIWLYDSDGSGTPQKILDGYFTSASDYVQYRYPEISPDGTKLLVFKYTNAGNTARGLYLYDLDGTNEIPVWTGASVGLEWPSFAPDGRRASVTHNNQIYRVSGFKGFTDSNDNDVADVCEIDSTDPLYSILCGYHCDGSPSSPCDTGDDCNGNGILDAGEADSDSDGTIDDCDVCPANSTKTTDTGYCGCSVNAPEPDTDSDGTPDCSDVCVNDSNKDKDAGDCGCGQPEIDGDSDGVKDCNDNCPADKNKTEPGVCGCGMSDADNNGNGIPDCQDGSATPTPTPGGGGETPIPTQDPGVSGCKTTDVGASLSTVTANMTKLYKQCKKAATLFKKAGGAKKLATKQLKKAKKAKVAAVAAIGTIPAEIKTECNSAQCVAASQVGTLSTCTSKSKTLGNIAKKLANKAKKLDVSLKKKVKKIVKAVKKLHSSNQTEIGNIPAETEQCSW